MSRYRAFVIWAALAIAILVPIALAAVSPLLAWRQPIYIVAGFAGIAAMGLLLLQPLLVGGYLPGFNPRQTRRIHRVTGSLLVLSVVLHVLGLWITSPPDVIDALLFASPTPFSVWGVTAMWAVFAAALLALFRKWWRLGPRNWRLAHTSLTLVTVIGSAIHAFLIVGTMETVSKIALCVLVVIATVKVIFDLKVWRGLGRVQR